MHYTVSLCHPSPLKTSPSFFCRGSRGGQEQQQPASSSHISSSLATSVRASILPGGATEVPRGLLVDSVAGLRVSNGSSSSESHR